MAASLPHPLEVETCIACGARGRIGDCEGGCVDLPLDLVAVGDLVDLAEVLAALRVRVAELTKVAEAVVAAEDDDDWATLPRAARRALRYPVPPAPEVEVVEAWGCPDCGRIDAPQPCLGVCVRLPVLMTNASRYHDLAADIADLRAADRRLTAVVRLVATVRPRPGHEQATRAALIRRARYGFSTHP